MNGFIAVARKEFTHLLRDRTTLFLALFLPVFQISMYGFAIDFDVRHIPTVVVDHDRSAASISYVQRLKATQYIDPDFATQSESEAASLMRQGRASVAVVIPPDFSRRMTSNDHPQVGVMVDGADSQVALRARSAFASKPTPTPGQVESRITVLYNPNMRTATFMIPGLIGFILQFVLISLTSGSIVREREQGSLEQLIVSPVSKLGLMLGKLAPFMVLALFEMVGIVSFGWLMFDVRVVGSLLLLIFMSLPFVFAALALGLVISTVAQNQNQSQQLSFLIILPSILMSGFIFPRDTMPGFLYVVSNMLPLTHELMILRGIAVRGASFGELLPPFASLCLISAVLMLVATRKFQKSMG